MGVLKSDLSNLDAVLPEDFTQEQVAKAKTIFYKKLALKAHSFYGGKIQVVPRAPVPGFNWFNTWYTPGVSNISTTIRDDNEKSFSLSARGNMVAVVSDSTRVLGDGDCTPPGGLGVMEGKAFLMKYLGGIDAVALCIDSRNAQGRNDPDKIIDFVKMCQHSFGAINLEDISQPNCYKVLDVLREECDIPVWHDDAQGTASVTLAGLINAIKLAGKEISKVRIVLLGAGASNTSVARLIIADGADPANIIMFDSSGSLNKDREDIKKDARFYRKWELCETTNPKKIKTIEEATKGADVLIALSQPGPDTVKPAWIRSMANKAIVFACANPIPEIYPYAAKEAGAFIVATGRGDFPNQVNNSTGFPGILKGALIVRSRKISDGMAIRAAHSLADYAVKRGITPENMVPTMDESDIFPVEAADVAMQAVKEGIARISMTWDEAYEIAKRDIKESRDLTAALVRDGFIKQIPDSMLESSLSEAVAAIRGK
jgi:malate dehydrogenase (oxaloacetate-decarboxylating)